MYKAILLAAVLFITGVGYEISAQGASDQAQTMASALDKTKYKKKQKRNISVEVYVDVRNVPAVKNAAAYTGFYDSDNYTLNLKVAADGTATGTGRDPDANGEWAQTNGFTLQNARVNGAVLTGTKVYENGKSEAFEAVFVNRTVSTGKNPNSINDRDVDFGLGFVREYGQTTSRVFMELED